MSELIDSTLNLHIICHSSSAKAIINYMPEMCKLIKVRRENCYVLYSFTRVKYKYHQFIYCILFIENKFTLVVLYT